MIPTSLKTMLLKNLSSGVCDHPASCPDQNLGSYHQILDRHFLVKMCCQKVTGEVHLRSNQASHRSTDSMPIPYNNAVF